MKIGILQCDSVLPEYQAPFGDYSDMFINLLHLSDPSLEFEIYPVVQCIYPVQINECDAYITTGSKDSVYDSLPWLDTFKDFIRELHTHNKKLVAICFGHQLVAEIFQGKTSKSHKGWGVGVARNRVEHHKSWMQPKREELNILVSHRDQVTALPAGAELLASSDFCPNFMYQLDNDILSIQGHPEFSKEYSATMMQHRRSKIGEQTYAAAQKSLQLEVDDHIVSQWILNFMREQ